MKFAIFLGDIVNFEVNIIHIINENNVLFINEKFTRMQ
jgi:hypothetical protein